MESQVKSKELTDTFILSVSKLTEAQRCAQIIFKDA